MIRRAWRYRAGTRTDYFFATGGGTGGVSSLETEQKASERKHRFHHLREMEMYKLCASKLFGSGCPGASR